MIVIPYINTTMTSLQTQKTPVPSGNIDTNNSSVVTTTNGGYRLPDINAIHHAFKLSIVEDKPIMMDYWTNSLDKTVLIGVKENGEKLLVRSEEEYTSPVSKIYKISNEYVIMTENSIYIVDINIPTKRIT